MSKKKLSKSHIIIVLCALKFFYEKTLGREWIPVPNLKLKRDKTIPKTLSEYEVARIINSIDNLKHKAIILIIYSAGLRISEAANLKIKHIDSEKMLIRIEDAKGNKDRYTILGKKTLLLLRKYCMEYKPKNWLFPGYDKNEPYNKRSIQKIFHKACDTAGIIKDVSVHTLRHSFATHLMEKGIHIRYIQEMLGHSSVKTTTIYTHVAQYKIQTITNPADLLDLDDE